MNAVEIEETISALAELPFDKEEFPFCFLQVFDNKETTLKRSLPQMPLFTAFSAPCVSLSKSQRCEPRPARDKK